MRLEKTIKSVLQKILVEQASPPGSEWTKIAPSEVTNFQTAGCTVIKGTDNKWYYKTSSCTPTPSPETNTGDGAGVAVTGVAVTAAVFKGIESILGKGLGTIRDGVMYVPNKIMEQYK